MRITSPVAAQLRRPRGRFAPIAAAMMNNGNRPLILASIDALELGAGARVVEVGFGGGLSLGVLLRRPDVAAVAGIDVSHEMVDRAERHHDHHVVTGRLVVVRASAETMPFADGEFDAGLAVQTVYFWRDLVGGFRQLHRVLRPGSRLSVGILSERVQDHFGWAGRPGYRRTSEGDVVDALGAAGFRHAGTRTLASPRLPEFALVVVAVKPQ